MNKMFELDLPTLSRFVQRSSLDLLEEVLARLKYNKTLKDSDPLSKKLNLLINKIQAHLSTEHRELFSKIENDNEIISETFLKELISEHQTILTELEEVRQIAEQAHYNDETFLEDLNEMDRIVLNHIQLEDHLFFPMILDRAN